MGIKGNLMNKNITKDKSWIFGMVVLIIGIILSISFPSVFKNVELIMGIVLVVIGIMMIWQIFKEKPTNY